MSRILAAARRHLRNESDQLRVALAYVIAPEPFRAVLDHAVDTELAELRLRTMVGEPEWPEWRALIDRRVTRDGWDRCAAISSAAQIYAHGGKPDTNGDPQ